VADDAQGAPSEPEAGEAPVAKTGLRPARGRTFLPELTGVEFSSARRGYDRAQVDGYVERVSTIVVELEAMRSPDAVIERALSDVGEETSAIIRRAREAAEEIVAEAESQAGERGAQAEAQARQIREEADRYTTRVRAAADQVLSDARAEAEQIAGQAVAEARNTREDADRHHEQVSSQVEQLAEQRHHLIEDLHSLADEFHRTADQALEQIPSLDASDRSAKGNGDQAPSEARSA
jgi:DivIVA domain-containing protein